MVQKIHLICTLLRKWVHFVLTYLILGTGALHNDYNYAPALQD